MIVTWKTSGPGVLKPFRATKHSAYEIGDSKPVADSEQSFLNFILAMDSLGLDLLVNKEVFINIIFQRYVNKPIRLAILINYSIKVSNFKLKILSSKNAYKLLLIMFFDTSPEEYNRSVGQSS